ncbi:CpXC domain-containing protein [Chloroflexota bacterium]
MKSYSLLRESRTGCGKCHKAFKFMNPLVINAMTDPQYVEQLRDLTLISAKCEYCGYYANVPLVFLYYDPSQTILWAVSTVDYETRYLQTKNIISSIISDYLKLLPHEELDSFKKLHWKYIPLPIFLQKIGSSAFKGKNMGYIHFYPVPRVSIDECSVTFDPPISLNQLDDYSVSLAEGNYPDFYDTLWSLLHKEFQAQRIYLHTQKLVLPKEPIATYGIPEIIIYIGSNIILPMFVGVFSSLLASLILDKVKAKKLIQESLNKEQIKNSARYELMKDIANKIFEAQQNDLTPSDKLKICLRVKEDSQDYCFSGSIEEVYHQLIALRKKILSSVRIPDNCHVVTFFADRFVDPFVEGDLVRKSQDLEETYGKAFSKSTRARFAYGKQAEYLNKALKASKRASILLRKKNYKAASSLLEKYLTGDSASIDILYNYALCQEALGDESTALFFFEQVLIRAINLPSLKEASDIIPGMPLEE